MGPEAPAVEVVPLGSGERVEATVRVPGSKSLTNRALFLAALAEGETVIEGALFSEDTRVCMEALRRVGVPLEADPLAERVVVRGLGGGPSAEAAALDVGLSGTTARFLCPYLALGHGRYQVDGSPRMRQRPMAPLVEALRAQGVRLEGGPTLPLTVYGAGGLAGGLLEVVADETSQAASGLLLAAPFARRDLRLRVRTAARAGLPYVDMTAQLMEGFGVPVDRPEPGTYVVPAGRRYRGRRWTVEPDASAAAYFWALAALSGGTVRTPGVGAGSLQGDVAFLGVLERMGCRVADEAGAVVGGPPHGRLRAVDEDMSAMSDQALTLAVLGLFADGPTRVRGVGHTRLQETDRVAAAVEEVRRLGARAEESPGGFTVWPLPPGVRGTVTVDPRGDHRVAMAFALAGLRRPGVTVADPGCVRKTFPGFFVALEAALGRRTAGAGAAAAAAPATERGVGRR